MSETGGRKACEISIFYRNCWQGRCSYFGIPLDSIQSPLSLQFPNSEKNPESPKRIRAKWQILAVLKLRCMKKRRKIFHIMSHILHSRHFLEIQLWILLIGTLSKSSAKPLFYRKFEILWQCLFVKTQLASSASSWIMPVLE